MQENRDNKPWEGQLYLCHSSAIVCKLLYKKFFRKTDTTVIYGSWKHVLLQQQRAFDISTSRETLATLEDEDSDPYVPFTSFCYLFLCLRVFWCPGILWCYVLYMCSFASKRIMYREGILIYYLDQLFFWCFLVLLNVRGGKNENMRSPLPIYPSNTHKIHPFLLFIIIISLATINSAHALRW